jgi:hypothetical protein
MRREFAMALALLCSDAGAQQVHRCVAGNGDVSYQSAACAQGTRETGAWQAIPEPPSTAQQQRLLEERRQRGRDESAWLSRRAGTDGSAVRIRTAEPHAPSACEAAKAQRQRTLDAIGLKRSFELLSRLDEDVRRACR